MLRSRKKLSTDAPGSREQTHLPRVTSLHVIRPMDQREKWASRLPPEACLSLAPHQNRNQAEPPPNDSVEILERNPSPAVRSPLSSFPKLFQAPPHALQGIEVSRHRAGKGVSTLLFPPVEWVYRHSPLAIFC